jgi:methionine synthase II (cobalamin-independent)
MSMNANCDPILIGSLPLTDHRQAIELIFQHTPAIPLWPQLPKNRREGMVRQFASGFPGLVDEGNRCYVDTAVAGFAQEMADFYEEAMRVEDDPALLEGSRFALGTDTAGGFSAFLGTVAGREQSWRTLKGQVTGPVTTGVGNRDQNGRCILYDENLADMLVVLLSLKARFQIGMLQKFCRDNPPIILVDEPALVSFGSSGFSGVSPEMVSSAVDRVIAAIKAGGATAGVHICANGDWGPSLLSDTDIISFDAYFYFENFILYEAQLKKFLDKGGILAWGIVPTGDPLAVDRESTASLYAKWRSQLSRLSSLGYPEKQLMRQTFIAPSCGTGSLTPAQATKVLTMTGELSGLAQGYLESL